MYNLRQIFPFSVIPVLWGTIGVLAVSYVGLIAVVMSYAALTVSFSQSVKNDEASVAVLESQYLGSLSRIENADYQALGYATPTKTVFVPGKVMTAMR